MPAGTALLVQVGQDVVRRPGVEARRQQPLPRLLGRAAADLAEERPQGAAEFERAPELVSLPEGQAAGHTGRGGDQDPVPGDVLDPPRGGAEGEHVARARLVDHLLVELTDPAAALLGVRPGQEDAEETAVGDGAAGGDGEALRAGAARDRTGDAVPHQAGAQLREGVGRIAPGEHVQDRGVGGLGERGEGRRAPHQGQQLVHVPAVEGHHGDDLLGEDVQGVGRHPQRLDGPLAHPLGHHGGLHQIAPVLGEDDTGRHGAHLVPGAAHPLEPGGDGRRGLHLDDEVHRAHVDAQFEAGGGHDGGQPARLEVLLDHGPLLLGHRTVVRAGQHRRRSPGRARFGHQLGRGVVLGQRLAGGALVRDLVEPVAQPLREAAGVGEDDRGAVRLHEVGDPLLHMRPDRGLVAVPGVLRAPGRGAAQLPQILHRDDHREVELLAGGRLDDLHLALRREIAGHLVHGAHGGRQPDAPGRPVQERVEPLQGQREVRAALRAGDGVHLVEDDGLHPGEGVPRRRGEHQEQRLGGSDQDVRRPVGDGPALGGRGVPRADADPDLGLGQAQPYGLLADAGERAAQIPLHVHREGLERRYVQHPAALLRLGGRRGGGQRVQRGEERGEGLAGAGRGDHQHVRALAQRTPGPGLRGRGRGEGPLEPRTGRGGERCEGRSRVVRHDPIVHRPTDNELFGEETPSSEGPEGGKPRRPGRRTMGP